MASNAFVALGGLAKGLGDTLKKKADQEHAEQVKHMDLITGLVSDGIKTGRVTDPDAAFKFLMDGGKGKKDLPPTLSTFITSIMGHHTEVPGTKQGQQPQQLMGGGTAATPSDPSSASGGPSDSPVSSSPSPGLPSPGSTAVTPPAGGAPRADPNGPGFGFLSTDQIEDAAVSRAGRTAEATTTAQYQAKTNLARRMLKDGVVKTIEEGLERVGLKEPRPYGGASMAPRPVALPLPVEAVPEGALTVSGEPFDPSTTKFAQKTYVYMGPNPMTGAPVWEARYEPSGQGSSAGAGGAEPAKFRERVTEIKAANPGISDEEARKQAGETLQAEAKNTAAMGGYRAQSAGESAGVLAGPYDDLPTVLAGADGKPDPAGQTAFLEKLRAKPKGGILATNVQSAAKYKMPTTAFTQRQIGGLNRETFIAMVKQFDPNFDEGKYKPRQDLMVNWTNGKVSEMMASSKKVVNHIGDLAKASTEIDKVSSNMAGGLANPLIVGATRLGVNGPKEAQKAQKALTDYKTAQNVLALELRRFFAAAGSGSLEEVEAWLKISNPYGTTTERKAFVNTAAKMMLGQVVPKVSQYRETMGENPPGNLWLDNRDRLRLRTMGVDISELPPLPEAESRGRAPNPAEASLPPEIQGLAPGMKATLPDGRVFFRDADGTLRGGVSQPKGSGTTRR